MTHQIIESLEDGCPRKCEDLGNDESTDEAFDRLLGAQTDERRTSKEHPTDVRKHVVADDEAGGNKEPDQALEDVVDHKVR